MRVEDIRVGPGRMRMLRLETVAALMESMRGRGLLQPIVVTDRGMLIAGLHRLEAARRLGWDEIDAKSLGRISHDDRLLVEIDENLIRAELGPAETALHHAERKRIYLKRHPETKRGGDRSKPVSGDRTKTPPYIEDAAEEVAQSRSTIALAVQRAASIPMLAETIGTCLDEGEELDALAKLSHGLQEDLIRLAAKGTKVSAKPMAKQLKRATREMDNGARLTAANALREAVEDRQFGVVYLDPPWRLETYSEAGKDRAADNHYATLDLAGITTLSPPMAEDCVVFMWATVPMLVEAMLLLEGWGFTYKSMMIWRKEAAGTGYWTRNNAELLLIATRGDVVAPAPGTQPTTVITAPAEGHSRKPAIFARVIEEWFPNTPKLEMYARPPFRHGWTVWGDEVPGGMLEVVPGEPVSL